jgi:hypothetical protein
MRWLQLTRARFPQISGHIASSVSPLSFDRQLLADRCSDLVEASPVGRGVTSLSATLPLEAAGIQFDDPPSRTIMTLGFGPAMFAAVSR